MAFWRSWSWDASAIDKLLENEHVSLEQLLDEDEILSEIKAQNKKLMDYLSKENNLNKVFSYVIEEYPDLTTEQKYRYSYLCAEILCSELYPLYDLIFQNNNYLNKLFGFWSKESLSHLLSGYNNRISSNFLIKKKYEVINFLKQNTQHIENMMKHLDVNAVVDLLLKIIASEDVDANHDSWLSQMQLVPRLIEEMNPKGNAAVHENVSQLLSSIIVLSTQNVNVNGGDMQLLLELEEEDNLNKLLQYIFAEPFSSAQLHGIVIIIELIRKNASDFYDFEKQFDNLPVIFKAVSQHFQTINELLKTPPTEEVRTTFGVLTPPVGIHRIKLVELVGILCAARYVCLYNNILQAGLLTSCAELFFQYQWNNFLHSIVSRAIVVILEANDSDISFSMIEKTQLHVKIAEAGNYEADNESHANLRKGYMGFITSLATVIQVAADVNENLQNILQSSPEWAKFIEGDYTAMKLQESKNLGGPSGRDSSDDEEGTNADPISAFQPIVKRAFENEFPKSFSVGDFDDDTIDSLLHPTGTYAGIPCEEEGFGYEFDMDSDSEENLQD